MKKIFLSLIAILITTASFASSGQKVIACWKGYNNTDQKNNLVACNRQVGHDQKCSSIWSEHRQAVYDVCMVESATPLRVVSLFKGWNQRDQNANLNQCKSQVGRNQVCVTNWSVHGGAVYDVALME